MRKVKWIIQEFVGGRFKVSVSRNDLQKNIFSKLENFVTNKECDYQFDIQKCYIDYQEEDKKYISTI